MMRVPLLFILAALISGSLGLAGVEAAPVMESNPQDGVLCTTRNQLRYAERCGNTGPSSALEQYARLGMYPEKPLATVAIDGEYSLMPYNYLRVGSSGADVYSNLSDALKGRNAARRISSGFLYVSWDKRYEEEGQIVYRITSGGYIRGDNVSRISTPTFQGLRFLQTPARPFGWIMSNGYTSVAPGFNHPQTDHYLYRYQVVQIYDQVQVGDLEWYMIGPGEWIEQRQIAMVEPDTEQPDGVPSEAWISVNLFEQTLAVYEAGELIFATLVSSGLQGWWTYPGVFQVHAELELDTMRGAFEVDRSDYYYLEDVPWVLYFDGARALHGAYWHNNFGFPQSHGCVNLAPTDAHWLVDWAEEGTWVYVFDPSGLTPFEDQDS